jgi:hypothetical protein
MTFTTIRNLALAAALAIQQISFGQSTAPEDQTASGEYQAELQGSDGSTATFYMQYAMSRDATGTDRAAVVGVSGYVHGQRDIVITGAELRAGEAVYRPGMAPRTPIRGQGDFSGGGTTGAATTPVISALIRNPESVEVRVLTEDQPEGLYRGRLKRATINYLAGFTRGDSATGWEVILASHTRNTEGRIDSMMVQSQISSIRGPRLAPVRGVYPWTVSIAGAGGTLIDFGSPADATATVGGFPGTAMIGISARDESRRALFERLAESTSGFQVRVTPTGNAAGPLAAPLQRMDRAIFHRRLGGPTDSVGYFEADFTRDDQGSVNSGVVFNITDWSTGALRGGVRSIRLHSGGADETGPAMMDLVTAETGAPVGRFLIGAAAVPPEDLAGRGAIDRLVQYPDLAYFNAVTADSPAGLRAQVLDSPGAPEIESISSATGGAGLAPGSLITIRGRRLAKVTSGVGDWLGTRVPAVLNGAVVQVGDFRAPVLFVSPTQINAQIPYEAIGDAAVVVNLDSAVGEVQKRQF